MKDVALGARFRRRAAAAARSSPAALRPAGRARRRRRGSRRRDRCRAAACGSSRRPALVETGGAAGRCRRCGGNGARRGAALFPHAGAAALDQVGDLALRGAAPVRGEVLRLAVLDQDRGAEVLDVGLLGALHVDLDRRDRSLGAGRQGDDRPVAAHHVLLLGEDLRCRPSDRSCRRAPAPRARAPGARRRKRADAKIVRMERLLGLARAAGEYSRSADAPRALRRGPAPARGRQPSSRPRRRSRHPLRRGGLQHLDDRLPGGAHRPLLPRPDRGHDPAAHRQLRHRAARSPSRSAPWVEGFVARRFTARAVEPHQRGGTCRLPPRATAMPALDGIDTRALVRRLRERGALRGVLTTERSDVARAARRGRATSRDDRPRAGRRGDLRRRRAHASRPSA